MCECKEQIENKLTEDFRNKNPEGIEHKVELIGYTFVRNGDEFNTRGCMPFEATAKFLLKNRNERKVKKVTAKMIFTYCPFCGEKY